MASTALSMAGQYQQQRTQEKSAKAAAEYNAQVAENEAATQKQLAQNEIQKGVADKERQQRQAARQMGEMRANMGASGFQMDTGSMASLLEESATEHQYDSNIIRQNSEQAAWQHMVGVTGANNNRAFAQYQGDNADSGKLGTYLGMGGTLLGGIAGGMGKYNAWQSTKAPEKKGIISSVMQAHGR
ncbi:hypothetical protein LJC46_04210 [Desulfovibrio sp. OttesenSCG-928-G15]|nr:hypothetical protein [Desulfovibrio sp. OttesenSCG-928-G15]